MTEAPIPMETAEALIRAANILERQSDPLDRRAVEVLMRLARRGKVSSVQAVDTLSALIRTRDELQRLANDLGVSIGRATTEREVSP